MSLDSMQKSPVSEERVSQVEIIDMDLLEQVAGGGGDDPDGQGTRLDHPNDL